MNHTSSQLLSTPSPSPPLPPFPPLLPPLLQASVLRAAQGSARGEECQPQPLAASELIGDFLACAGKLTLAEVRQFRCCS